MSSNIEQIRAILDESLKHERAIGNAYEIFSRTWAEQIAIERGHCLRRLRHIVCTGESAHHNAHTAHQMPAAARKAVVR